MNFKNEKSKIYTLGNNILSMALIVLAIVYFMNRSNRELADTLFIIQEISLSLFLILMGTEKILIKKDKKGYFYCIFGGIILIIFIVSFLVKYF
ncbi:hypothetical protein [Tepidibacter sp. Z1-5]|uniref:hypothetical protein n=1 Tax=Tepidibacter sp. Z1-5 TaxID=3134138 RepID=UPI0030BF873A